MHARKKKVKHSGHYYHAQCLMLRNKISWDCFGTFFHVINNLQAVSFFSRQNPIVKCVEEMIVAGSLWVKSGRGIFHTYSESR